MSQRIVSRLAAVAILMGFSAIGSGAIAAAPRRAHRAQTVRFSANAEAFEPFTGQPRQELAQNESDQGSGFSEENIPPPSPAASGSPSASPGVSPTPGAGEGTGFGTPPTPSSLPSPTPLPQGYVIPPGQLSDLPLPGALGANQNPTRRIGLDLVNQARQAIISHNPDQALRLLGRALSVDADDPYIYFYLGRAYLAKQNYQQALTFFEHATIGFANNPQWLGEAYGFAGAASEEMGDIARARTYYQQALAVAPANRLAQSGYQRLGPVPQPLADAPQTGPPPPPTEPTPPPPPDEPPPPAAP